MLKPDAPASPLHQRDVQRLADRQNQQIPVPMAPRDRRGRSGRGGKRIPSEQKEAVRQHIDKFPRYLSHYRRNAAPNRRYITAVSGLSELYRDYTADCREKGKTPVKEALYRQIFNRDFNISFRLPLQDTCHVCDRAAQTGCTPES